MMKLPSVFKTAWLARLRDPEIPQARFNLKTDDGFCCLGVAIDLANGPSCWILAFDDRVYRAPSGDTGLPLTGDLPPDVLDVLNHEIGPAESVAQRLAGMNDAEAPFTEIAIWIEENL